MDPSRNRAILTAARQLLAAKGFTGMSMDAVAKAAGVGKDTLYRRWSSKAELVHALLTTMAEDDVPLPPDDLDPRDALVAFLQRIVAVNTQTDFGPIIAGLVGAASRNDKLAESFHTFWQERRGLALHLIRQITGPSMSTQQLEHVLDQVAGPIYYRLLLTGTPVTDAFIRELVDGIVGPDGRDNHTLTEPNPQDI